MAAFDAAVRESQARRWVVYPALRNGAYYPWDFQPLQKASERYMRNHMDLNVLEEQQTLSARRMMTDPIVPTLDHLKRAYAVTSQATQMTPLLESRRLPARPVRRASSSSRNCCNGPAPSRCAAPIGG